MGTITLAAPIPSPASGCDPGLRVDAGVPEGLAGHV
jgi:hypothetical protein